eukprot:scaffold140561_cov485-Phaeocystis_antarctica.AAC.2
MAVFPPPVAATGAGSSVSKFFMIEADHAAAAGAPPSRTTAQTSASIHAASAVARSGLFRRSRSAKGGIRVQVGLHALELRFDPDHELGQQFEQHLPIELGAGKGQEEARQAAVLVDLVRYQRVNLLLHAVHVRVGATDIGAP